MAELFRIFREGIAAVLLIVSEHQYLAKLNRQVFQRPSDHLGVCALQ